METPYNCQGRLVILRLLQLLLTLYPELWQNRSLVDPANQEGPRLQFQRWLCTSIRRAAEDPNKRTTSNTLRCRPTLSSGNRCFGYSHCSSILPTRPWWRMAPSSLLLKVNGPSRNELSNPRQGDAGYRTSIRTLAIRTGRNRPSGRGPYRP